MYIYLFLVSFFLALALTWLVKKIAVKFNFIDKPDAARKLHKKPMPLLGGWAIFAAASIVLFWQRELLVSGQLAYHHWLGVWLGGLILMIGGTMDDKYNLSSKWQLLFPVLASLAVIMGGVGIEKVTNPLAGLLFFSAWQAYIFTFIWLMGMIFTTKLVDGIDGLSSGLTTIGCLIIFLFTATTRYYQSDIAVAALVFAGATFGFLVWNWHPAKIFVGDGGSLLLGFVLGVLSIISGGKIAIALLIMGIPILDVIWTIGRRLLAGKNPLKSADRQHLHFRLQDRFGVRQTVLIYSLLAAVFGLSALFLQAKGKLFAVLILALIMAFFVGWFSYVDKKNRIS